MTVTTPKTRDEWLQALNELPSSPAKIPAFFFAHSSPMMEMDFPGMPMSKNGPLSSFLKDFGQVLVKKYQPKAVVVFSAHWDTDGQVLGTRRSYFVSEICAHICGRSCILVTDYGNENPLYYDYYGFSSELYQLKFKSRGDSNLACQVVKLYEEVGVSGPC